MTVLVTGATGFIGSRVVLNLGKKQLPIVAADLDLGQNKSNLENKNINLGFDKNLLTFEKLDISDQDNVGNLFSKYSFDIENYFSHCQRRHTKMINLHRKCCD